jgi:competence CoiA-like predicted nuclease
MRTIRNTQMHSVDRMQSSVIYTNSVRTSQETHYITATKSNRLMLFIVRTIRNTQIHFVGRILISVIYIYSVRASQETQYVSTTKPNRLMLFRETKTNKTNSVVSVRKRTISTERLPLVGEVSANFSG